MNADLQNLHKAFEQFAESSSLLQMKYETLLAETQELRNTIKLKDAEIKRQEKLALLGETAASIAHEVRNPLGAIKLFVSLLRQDCADKSDSIVLINQIDTSIERLEHVVTNMLQFSSDKKINFAPINLHSIIQEQLLSFPRSESNTAFFELDLKATPFLLGSDTALRQIIYNLVLNALQATRYKGNIYISTSDILMEDKVTEALKLTILDNGTGINPDLIESIFEPFVTSKNEGTGLGLSIVKQLVLQHNGTISASNHNGALFTVILPKNKGN